MLESDSDHHAFHQSTQYHMVVRLKACGNVTVGGALSSMWNPLGQNHLARRSERGKKTKQTETEVGRQHQGMDRPGVLQVPKSSGEQRKMEESGCKVICGAPTTLAVKE